MRKTVYERSKGKQMNASGEWETTRGEQRMIYAIGIFFAVSVLMVLASPLIHNRTYTIIAIICCALSFILMFVGLFGIAFKKMKEQPMQTHYTEVDYTYNALTGEEKDLTHEITREEFFQKKECAKEQ